MKSIARIAAIYVLVLLSFGWGLAVASYQIFPYEYLKPVQDDLAGFVGGDIDDDSSLTEKFLNDLGISPERMIRDYGPAEKGSFREVALAGTNERRNAPRIFVAPEAPKSYRLIVGAFDFTEAFWGAVLLDPDGQVVHRWAMNGEIDEISEEPDVLKNLYGVAFFPDGSAAFSMQEKLKGIVKVDVCSNVQWVKPGIFHHVVQPTEDNRTFWTYGGDQGLLHPILVEVDVASGETLTEIDMADVERANPDLFIFDFRRRNGPDHDEGTHPNHIEELPTALGPAFPMFAPGDLVQSYHTTNLIFVIDPKTLKVKWYHIGAGDGQHDPDWHADGTISIFNNKHRIVRRNLPPHYSSIVSIDPATGEHRTVVPGEPHNFYSSFNGHHEFTDDGTVVITSSTQGRVFEVDLATGKSVFEYVNAYEWDEDRTLHLSETFIIDEDVAKRWIAQDCPAKTAAKGS